jgi:hypothetical protein
LLTKRGFFWKVSNKVSNNFWDNPHKKLRTLKPTKIPLSDSGRVIGNLPPVYTFKNRYRANLKIRNPKKRGSEKENVFLGKFNFD